LENNTLWCTFLSLAAFQSIEQILQQSWLLSKKKPRKTWNLQLQI